MEERRDASLCLDRNSLARTRYSLQSNIGITRTLYRGSRLPFAARARPTTIPRLVSAVPPARDLPELTSKSEQTVRCSGDLSAPRLQLELRACRCQTEPESDYRR